MTSDLRQRLPAAVTVLWQGLRPAVTGLWRGLRPAVIGLWRRLRPATWAWLALLLLTLVSVTAAGHAQHGGSRLGMTLAVAALALGKAWLLLHHFLELPQAARVFRRLVWLFAGLAPALLVASALHEAWPAG